MSKETQRTLGIIALVMLGWWLVTHRLEYLLGLAGNLAGNLAGIAAILFGWPALSGWLMYLAVGWRLERISYLAPIAFSFGCPFFASLYVIQEASNNPTATLQGMSISTLKTSAVFWLVAAVFAFGMWCGVDHESRRKKDGNADDYDP